MWGTNPASSLFSAGTGVTPMSTSLRTQSPKLFRISDSSHRSWVSSQSTPSHLVTQLSIKGSSRNVRESLRNAEITIRFWLIFEGIPGPQAGKSDSPLTHSVWENGSNRLKGGHWHNFLQKDPEGCLPTLGGAMAFGLWFCSVSG